MKRRARKEISKQCPRCRYSLEDLPDEGACPECGRQYDPDLLNRVALYRREIRWLWRFGIGWPILLATGLALAGSFQSVQLGLSFFDDYMHVFILFGVIAGIVLPLLVAWFRHARIILRHGDRSRVIMFSSGMGSAAGMTLILPLWALFDVRLEQANSLLVSYLFMLLIPLLLSVMAIVGSAIGERIGVRIEQRRASKAD